VKVDDPAIAAELTAQFRAYEAALMANDLAALNGFFWPSPLTLRFGDAGAAFGIEQIAAFRAARVGGSPRRTLRHTRITSFGADYGVATTEFKRENESRLGRQTQVWVKFPDLGWRIVSAHISLIEEKT
jgi:hypothetical protein